MRITVTTLKEKNKKRFDTSKEAKIPKKVFVTFFDNNAMARVLDLFIENKNLELFTSDIVEKASISDKSFQQNAIILEKLGVLTHSNIGKAKLYRWNKENEYAILITKLWHRLNVHAIRRINT